MTSDHIAKGLQIGLLAQYAIAAVLFGMNKKTWPVALYYVGCFVKDSGVYALAWLEVFFK